MTAARPAVLCGLVLLLAVGGALADQNSPENLCDRIAVDKSGFICVDNVTFVQCSPGTSVSAPLQCAPGTVCLAPPLTLVTDNPCVNVTTVPCGNGAVDQGEQCDSGVGCTDQCTCGTGFTAANPPAKDCLPVAICGNGVVDSGEQCDSGVGCSSTCICEPGFTVASPAPLKDCVRPSLPICGDLVVQAGEQCDSGIGCSSSCLCQQGFVPKVPPSVDCAQPQPACGNGVLEVQAGEQCEVGGLGCSEDCKCRGAFVVATPPDTNCFFVPGACNVCGDGVVELSEECEVGGFGCSDKCTCQPGFEPASPLSADCQLVVPQPASLRDICVSLTSSVDDSGFVCMFPNAPELLRCHLLEEVSSIMPCPANTLCQAPAGVFTVDAPCLTSPLVVPPILPVPVFPPNCPVVITTPRPQPQPQPQPPPPAPVFTRPRLPANVTLLCSIFGMPGFFCPANFGVGVPQNVFSQCAEGGAFAGSQECAPGSLCAPEGFTQDNPCVNVTLLCGDGVLEAGEQCDQGLGCDNATCQCMPMFNQTSPASSSCELNATAVCEELNATAFLCPSVLFNVSNTTAFVLCLNQTAEVFECPAGTVCNASNFTSGNPCRPEVPLCGDGIIEGSEECEILIGGQGCDRETCTCLPGFSATFPPGANCTRVPSVCGDGIVEGAEQCEVNGSACNTSTCQCLPGFSPVEGTENCTPSNATVVCTEFLGLGSDITQASCVLPLFFPTTFVVCDPNGAQFAAFIECAPDTTCKAEGPVLVNPCMA